MQRTIRPSISRARKLRTTFAGFVSMVLFSGLLGDEVALSWTDNSTNEDGFIVERATATGEFEQLAQVGADVVSYTDGTAIAGIDYRYRVCAFNVFGYSDYTNVASFYKNLAPTISPIENVLVAENQVSNPVVFSIGDFESLATQLSLTIQSSNPGLIDEQGIAISGEGAERAIVLQPKQNASGDSAITVSVSDGEDSSSRQFFFSVASYAYPSLQLSVNSTGTIPRANEGFFVETAASDSSLVASVSYWLGSELLETVSSSPYTTELSVSQPGSYGLRAVASLVGRNDTVSVERAITVNEAASSADVVANFLAVTASESAEPEAASYDPATDQFILVDEFGEISGSSDRHRYFYLRASGDVSLRVRVAELQAASVSSVAGLMLRSALYGKASQSSLLLDGESRLLIRTRDGRGESTIEQEVLAGSGTDPWLRIDKAGSSLSYYTRSSSSQEWVLLHEAASDLGSEFFVGLALAAGSSGGQARVSFEQVSLEGEIVVAAGEGSQAPEVPTGLVISSFAK